MKGTKYILISLLSVFIFGCEEEPIVGCMDELAVNYNPQAVEEGVCEFDASDVLLSNSWFMESVTGEFAGSTINLLDLELLIPSCTHDNLFLFHEDNSVTMDDHIDLCEDGEESVLDITGVWTVENDVLTIVNGVEEYVLTITNLTSSSMDLNFDYYWADFDANIPAKIVLIAN